jgi:FKBP-type peptidyl-prolyl cis-trans isomerase 2
VAHVPLAAIASIQNSVIPDTASKEEKLIKNCGKTNHMTDTIKIHDFVEISYTGKLTDGTIFDTTDEKIAHEHHFHDKNVDFTHPIICVGEKQLLPGLDEALVGKELNKDYSVTLPPELAFGKRDIKKMKIVPISTFKEHKVQPQPGLQIDVDGERGTVTRVAGGRIIVNFNHPLAGKEIIYDLRITRKVTDRKEQVSAFLSALLRIPKDKFSVEVDDEKAQVTLPVDFPAQITDVISKKLVEVTGVKEVLFKKK